jgi:hypothetical protein
MNKFMGCSVSAVSVSAGLGLGQQSQLTAQLVEDLVSGDVFAPPTLTLTPAYFESGAFRFNGLYQRYEKNSSTQGKNLYTVTLVDPREILDCVQVILSSYTGVTDSVKNVFNIYGALETGTGFGAAGVNEGGMPWVNILKFLKQVTNQPTYGLYGGPIHFRGVRYSLDLSELPTMPLEYRVSADFIGLTELIAQICEDGGCDFWTELDGLAIKVRTVSRLTQPPLGTIAALATAGYGTDLIRSTSGVEARNEVTSCFLIGGSVQTLYLTNNIVQYWGNDFGGNPVIGFNRDIQFFGTVYTTDEETGDPISIPNQLIHTESNVEHMNLNAGPIAGIIGDIRYTSDIIEMRMARVSQSSWITYIGQQKPSLAALLGITNTFQINPDSLPTGKKPQLFPANPRQTDVLDDTQIRINAVYDFVKGYADEYYGRKFLARMPFTVFSRDDETLELNSAYSISDGGYLPEGASPLGLSPLNENLFTNPDGRFRAFARMRIDKNDDISNLSPSSTVLEPVNSTTYELFTLAQTEADLIFTDFSQPPYVIFTIDPIYEKQPTIGGDFVLPAAILGSNDTDLIKEISKNASAGNVDVRLSPPALKPTSVAIPIKDNRVSYGPWFANGAVGKTRVERDESLVPWNYGGYDLMNTTAMAKVTSAITNTEQIETGVVERAGLPTASLGDILEFGGPIITNIDINYSPSSISTTYRFSTFTNKFGLLNKSTTERMKRINTATQQLKRNVKSSLNDIGSANQVRTDARRAKRAFMEAARKEIKKDGSPHEIMIAKKFFDNSVSVANCTIEEALTTSMGSGEAIASLGSIFNPYIVGSGEGLPSFDLTSLHTTLASGDTISGAWLIPFGIPTGSGENLVFSRGSGSFDYVDNENGLRSNIIAKPRGVALRQPIILAGEGVDFHAKTYPSGETQVGPLECYWNDQRKLWSTNNVLFGTVMSGSGSNYTTAVAYDNGAINIAAKTVSSPSGVAFASGENVLLFAPLNKGDWYILNNSTRIPAFTTVEDICIQTSSGGLLVSAMQRGKTFNEASQEFEEFCEEIPECEADFCGPIADCNNLPLFYTMVIDGVVGEDGCELMNAEYSFGPREFANPNAIFCVGGCGWRGTAAGTSVQTPEGCLVGEPFFMELCSSASEGIIALRAFITFPQPGYEMSQIPSYSCSIPIQGQENEPLILTKTMEPESICCDWPETITLYPQ